MSIGYIDPLSRGFARMKTILFNPFDLGKWLVIGFAAWLAQLAGGPGGGSFNPGGDWKPDHVGRGVGSAVDRILEHAFVIPLILLVVLLVAAFVLLLVWLSSRGKLVLLDDVVHDRAAIVEPWKRLGRLGDSLFLWRVGFGLACAAVVVLILLVMIGPASIASSWHDAFAGLSFAGIFVGSLLIAALVVVALYVSLFLDAFVVPIMYRYNLKATAAWRALMPWISAHAGHFVLFGLFVLLLAIGFGLVFLVVCLFTCCIAALPYIGTVIFLPVWVTYRAFTIEFLAQLDPGFDLFAAAAAKAAESAEVVPSE